MLIFCEFTHVCLFEKTLKSYPLFTSYDIKRNSKQNSQYSNITAVLDHLLQLQIFPPTMYCTVQSGKSTDSTLVNCSPIYICGLANLSVTSVIHRYCQQPLTMIGKSSLFKAHPLMQGSFKCPSMFSLIFFSITSMSGLDLIFLRVVLQIANL